MALNLKSKRERCAQCDSAEMTNLVIVEPGEDMQVFVECAACGACCSVCAREALEMVEE